MKVTFLPSNTVVEVEEGTTIMKALHQADIHIDAPCGGNGTCKKCKVKLITDEGEHTVLACQTEIMKDVVVDVSRKDEGHRILMGGISRDVKLDPAVRAVTVNIPKPTTSDLRSSWDRLRDTVAKLTKKDTSVFKPNISLISKLYCTLEDNNYKVDAIICEDEILDVVPVGSPVLGLAYDIGTTTIACYFIDLRSGTQLAQASVLNPQTTYGGDVIMRIKYSIENGLEGPTGDVQEALNKLAMKCAAEAKKNMNSIYMVTIVGNTCMHHLFMGISPASLAYAPYTPAVTDPVQVMAADYGFTINKSAKLYMLSNIAGFVGADTVGASLAAAMDEAEKLTLLIDIGTNGEMVLGTKNRRITCSTAAGPAFEGALITYGMRGAEGAVDHATIVNGKLDYTVIGDLKPMGICGSGIIDLLSELVRVELVDAGGKMLMGDEITDPEGIKCRSLIQVVNGIRAFVIADETVSGNGEKIVFTQRDVREVQLAKGAMAAGMRMLAKRINVSIDDVEVIMIAGAFGNYMSPKSACGIGLIPPKLESKVIGIGNAAGQGAKLSLLSLSEYKRSEVIGKSNEYLELAAEPGFQDVFVDQLEFPSEY